MKTELMAKEILALLLEPYGLDIDILRGLLNKTLIVGTDSSDIYLEYSKSESWELKESIIHSGEFSLDKGFGIRVISNDKTGFAYADNLDKHSMERAAAWACNISRFSNGTKLVDLNDCSTQKLIDNLYPAIDPLVSMEEMEKIKLLRIVDDTARNCDHRVKQVHANLVGSYKIILIVNNEGRWNFDIRPMVHLDVSVLIEDGLRKEYGNCGGGGRVGYEKFFTENLGVAYAKEAVRVALLNLDAIAAPAGVMPIVLGNGWPAVMLHEAVGHGLEADFNRKESSVYVGMLGKVVASKEVSIVDQGNIPGGKRGSLNVDDEGTATQRTLLIEDGVLCSYMYDKLNAKLMKTSSTGNGRRSSYAEIPLPRMTNTYMLNGKYFPLEIIESVKKGIYAVNFNGGQVDITSGEFVFSTSEAYLIERGKIGAPIKGVTLIGNGPKVLGKISMVGNDLAMDGGIGVCGKQGQNIAVGLGQPTLKIDELTVGGSIID